MLVGTKTDMISYDSGISLNSNLSFNLNGSSYSSEIEISSYINNIFNSINECLEGFNNLVTKANSYIQNNNDIANIPVPSLKSIDFSINPSGLVFPTLDAKVKTQGGSLRVREGEGTNTNIIDNLQNGQSVKILKKGNEWSKVSYTDKNNETKEGYVSNDYLNEDNSTKETTKTPEVKAENTPKDASPKETISTSSPDTNTSKKYNVNISDKNSHLNVRSGPSTNNNIKSTLKYNETVKVLGTEGDWYKVQIGDDPNNIGYVSKKYIKES